VPPSRNQERQTRPALFWLYTAHLVAVVQIALSNVLLAFSALSVPWAGVSPRSVWRRGRALLIALAVYLFTFLLSYAFSLDHRASAGALSEPFNLLVVPLALVFVSGERAVRRVVDSIVGMAGLSGLYGLGQYVDGFDRLSHRIHASFTHYMTFSGVLLVADLLILSQAAAGRMGTGWRAAWRWGALLAINAALVGTFTRNAWVGLAVAVTLLVILRSPRWLLAYPVVALVFVLLAPRPILGRVGSIADPHDPSNWDRLCMARSGLAMIADRPVVGLGPNMARRLYPEYRLPSALRKEVPHLHDSFLQLAAERGLPALASYLALILVSLAAAWRMWRREGKFAGGRADLLVGVIAALVAFNVAGLFENNWGDTEVQRLALFVLALPFCLGPTETPASEGAQARPSREG
jgi:O-antigen ligase